MEEPKLLAAAAACDLTLECPFNDRCPHVRLLFPLQLTDSRSPPPLDIIMGGLLRVSDIKREHDLAAGAH